MIERSFDADKLNALVNDPSIRPHVGGDPDVRLDLTAAVANPNNVFLLGEHGGFLCDWMGPGDYQIHTFILPDGRGPWGFAFAKAGREKMAEMGALHLWTRVATDARHTRAFTMRAGFKPAGQDTLDLGVGPVTYDLYDWRPACQ